MKRSALISDIIFAFFAAFLCTLFLFRYLGIRLWGAVFLAAICGALTAAATAAFLQSKRKTVFLKRSDEARKEKLLFHLACLSDEEVTRFFFSRLQTEEENVKRFGKLRLYTEAHFYQIRFGFTPVNADEVAAFSRLKTNKEKVLLCSKIEDQAYALAQRLQMRIMTGNEVYAYLKDNDGLPEKYVGDENAEIKRKRRFELWFSRKNAKPFLVAAALTLFSALISPFPYYYILFGSLFLIASILIRIFGYN